MTNLKQSQLAETFCSPRFKAMFLAVLFPSCPLLNPKLMPPRDGHRTRPPGPGWSCDPAAGGREAPQAWPCLGTAPDRQLLRCRKRLWSRTDTARELWCRSANQRSASCKSLILKENACCKLNKWDLQLMLQALCCSPQHSRKKLPSQVAFLLILYTVIYVIVWIHFLFKLLQVSKYCDFGFLY